MRVASRIDLSLSEINILTKNINSRLTPVRLLERSRIILMANDGVSNKDISKVMGIPQNKVGRWRNRYAEGGYLAISKDKPRGDNYGGKDSSRQMDLKRIILKKTTQETPKNATHWSTRLVAEELGCQHSFVSRVWQEYGLKPHLVKTFKVSNDPKFEEKLKDVVGLYVDPPEKAIVLSVDEKSSIQALDRTQPTLPLKKGRCGTMTHDHKRNGTSTLFAALDVLTGKVIGQCLKKHRHQEFLKFLNKIDKNTNKELDIHIIVDNYATHKHPKVKEWLSKHKRFKFHFIPTSSSWLNLVERFFGLITEKQIRRGVFRSVSELEQSIYDFIDINNQNPKPFTWTKSAEEIILKVNRARKKLDKIKKEL